MQFSLWGAPRFRSTSVPLLLSSVLASACSSEASDGKGAGEGNGDAGSGGASGAGSGGSTGAGGARPPGPDSGDDVVYSLCDPEERIGAFSVQLVAATNIAVAFTQVDGRVRNGIDPREIWVQGDTEGDCAILTGPTLSCGTPCSGGQVCAGPDLCIDPPVSVSVGQVSLSGLLGPVSMTPNGQSYYYFAATGANALPFPPVTPGSPVHLAAAGAGDVAGFGIVAEGIAPLEVTSAEPTVTPGEPVTVTWAPPSGPTTARVAILLDLAHHGGIAARLVCDVPDTGSSTLSADMLGKLVARGTAGFPTMNVLRHSVGSTTTRAGCVELSLSSSTEVSVAVAGVESCQVTADCTGGKVCQSDYTCR